MKNTFLILFITFSCLSWGQQTICTNKNDGTTEHIQLKDIEKITFDADEMTLYWPHPPIKHSFSDFRSISFPFIGTQVPTRIIEKRDLSISIYPNPTTNWISTSKIHDQVEIFSIDGQLVLHRSNNTAKSINISHLEKGSYIIKADNQTELFIKK